MESANSRNCVRLRNNAFVPPLIDEIADRQNGARKSRAALFWMSISLSLAGALYLDSCSGFLRTLSSIYPVVSYIVVVAIVCFVGFALLSLFISIRFYWTCPILYITPKQKALFGVKEDGSPEIDTQGPQFTPSAQSYACSPPHQLSPYSPTQSPYSFSFNQSFSPSILDRVSHSFMKRVVHPSSNCSTRYSSPLPGGAVCGMDDAKRSGGKLQNSPSFSNSFSSVQRGDLSRYSPHNLSDSAGTGMMAPRRVSPNISPMRSDDFITKSSDLEEYFREECDKELREQQAASAEMSRGPTGVGGLNLWTYNRMIHGGGVSPLLHKYQYQSASRSPQSPTATSSCKDSVTDDSSSSPLAPDVWTKLDVCLDNVDRWVENLRKWISLTILKRIVSDIDEVNRNLAHIGSDDVKIGEVSLSILKQTVLTKAQHVPKLESLLPYLEVNNNQEYLVQRLKELAETGCMSVFKWNGGGDFKSKPWEENLPTDSAIVIHMLCTYMDSRIPAHPKHPDGKTFTNQHFLRVPDKPRSMDRKDNLCIYQTRVIPPHFKVIIDDNIWNMKPGRNNLFHAILLFLHHVKTKEHGMLRRVNLGLSGINILWVFDG